MQVGRYNFTFNKCKYKFSKDMNGITVINDKGERFIIVNYSDADEMITYFKGLIKNGTI